MNSSSPNRLRRRLCFALPAAIVTGTFAHVAHAQDRYAPVTAEQGQPGFRHPALYRSSFDVAVKLDMFGETTEQVVRVGAFERFKLSGVHGNNPWTLELGISHSYRSDNLRLEARLLSGDEVLAAPVRNATAGQRVVLRADDDIYASVVIRNA